MGYKVIPSMEKELAPQNRRFTQPEGNHKRQKKQISMKYVFRANHFFVGILPTVVLTEISMKYTICPNPFSVDILPILVPTKIMKYTAYANHYLVDVDKRDPHH